ncbi:hypothetical protein LRP50_00680 [Enterovibrio sp. ZSDZ42]|uniref:Uncharacterized protein n=2 Tax=Enterovibrio TaxID=188143 RepID=A0ABT5QUF3_9GAMM|nr:hypothetical protein [Enterovibrio sp. ZSDZ42]MDD1791642.1 hypothetical protein [Enterovibrio sp. ZSDZ42]
MGLPKHVFVFGLLLWGLPTAFIYALINSLLTEQSFLAALSTSIVIWPLGGIFYGLYSWIKTKRQFAELEDTK